MPLALNLVPSRRAIVRLACVLLACALVACARAPETPAPQATETPSSSADAAYLAQVESWRAERETRLREPDGWLSFAGSGQVSTGAQRVGSAPGNDIVVPGGPAQWGVLHLDADGTLHFDATAEANVTVDGKPFKRVSLLTQLDDGGPTSIHASAQRFYVVKTAALYGWRFRDPAAPALQAFKGVPHFPVDPSWRINAHWEAYPEPREIQLVTSNGTLEAARVPGRATFDRDGKTYALLPVQEEGDDELFFILADRTSGQDTYGGGRFLYAALPVDGTLELDFNKALNPPCALNGHVVCPLAPPENRLDLRVAAGETTYPLAKTP